MKSIKERGLILKKITRPIYIGNSYVLIRLMSNNMMGYFLKYNIQKDPIEVNIRFFYRETDGIDRYYDIKSNNTYTI